MVQRRRFLQSAISTPIALSIIPNSVLASQTIFTDSFENDEPGATPDGWSHFANENQQVVDQTASDGSHSFRMAGDSGGCWEATAYHPCSIPDEGRTTFSGAVKPTTEGEIGCHSKRGRLMIATSGDSIYPDNARTLLNFDPDSRVTGVSGHDVGTYELDSWNTYQIGYQRNGDSVTVSYQLNGEDRGETTYSAAAWENNLSHLHLQSGDVAVYWDDFSVTSGNSETTPTEPSPDTTDLRSISYGETKTGEIDESDPTGYYGNYEPVTFSGNSGEVITITMTSDGDPRLILLDPSGNRVTSNDDHSSLSDYNSRIQEYELQSSGEYTIVATSFDEDATFTYELSLERIGSSDDSESNSHYRLQVVNDEGTPVSGARVRITHVPSELTLPASDPLDIVSESTTNDSGYAIFDGEGGEPLPNRRLNQLSEEYSGRLVVSVWTPDEDQPWFWSFIRESTELFSEWNNAEIPLQNQIMFGPSNGGNNNGTVTVWRSLSPVEERRQRLYISVFRKGDSDYNSISKIGNGMAAFSVPESIEVDYALASLETTGNEYNPLPISFALSNSYPNIPPYTALSNIEYQNTHSNEVVNEAVSGIVGQLPVIGTLTGFSQTMLNLFDVGEGIQYTIGPGTETNKNTRDIVSASWNTPGLNYVFSVPITFPDEQQREFAGRAIWNEAGSLTDKIEFDAPFTIDPTEMP